MTEPVSDAGSKLEEVVADWVATSGLTPSRKVSLVVARINPNHAVDLELDLDLDVSRLPPDAVLLVVARVRDDHSGEEVLRVLREWQASRRGLRLVRFEDLAAEDGGSWWRLTYRPSADAHGAHAVQDR